MFIAHSQFANKKEGIFWFETVSPNYSQPGERLRINRRKCSGFFMYRARDILKCRGKVKPLAPIYSRHNVAGWGELKNTSQVYVQPFS